MWHLEGKLPSTSQVARPCKQRIGGLTAEARSVVELIALCQPVELGYLESDGPYGALESLERFGLVTVTPGTQKCGWPIHSTPSAVGPPCRDRERGPSCWPSRGWNGWHSASGPATLRSAGMETGCR